MSEPESVGIRIGKARNGILEGNVISGFDTGISIEEIDDVRILNNIILRPEAKEIFRKSLALINANALEIREKISSTADRDIKERISTSLAEGKASILQTIESLSTICSNVISCWPALCELLNKLAAFF